MIAGMNFVDIYHRRGTYPIKLPFIPYLEGAGVVPAQDHSQLMHRFKAHRASQL
jgi:NADPH:quinone reductase-like Zn-dependent oxidoreductase